MVQNKNHCFGKKGEKINFKVGSACLKGRSQKSIKCASPEALNVSFLLNYAQNKIRKVKKQLNR